MKKYFILLPLFFIFCFSCNWGEEHTIEGTTETTSEVPNISYSLVGSFPHDTNAFTEGLFIHDGKFYESTGGPQDYANTKSLFGILDTATGLIDAKVTLDKQRFFGEGITLLNGRIYQLTYKSRIGFVYDAKTYKELKQFSIPTAEGWGMTTDGKELIMSNGSNELIYLNPETLQFTKKVNVTENGYAVDLLNELEYVNGYIFANVYTTNTIVKIDATSGEVVGKMDLSSLFQEARRIYPYAIEMNGIAYDGNTNKLYVTGKFWPKVYELSLNAAL